MAKIFDAVSLTVITFLLTFVWTALLFDNALAAIIMSCTLTLIAVVTARYVKLRAGKPYTYDRLALEFGIRGNEYIISLLRALIKDPDVVSGANFIALANCMIVACYRFAQLGIGDIGGVCTLAKRHSKKRVFLICRAVDRRAYSVAQLEGVKLTPVRTKAVYKLLKKYGALPDLKPVKEKFSIRLLIDTVLARANFKSYAFSGTILVLVSFITPLRIYYIVMGSVSLVLALLTLTPLGRGNFAPPSLSAELENAITLKPAQISIDEILDE